MYVTVPEKLCWEYVVRTDVCREREEQKFWEISVGISAVWSFQFVHREENYGADGMFSPNIFSPGDNIFLTWGKSHIPDNSVFWRIHASTCWDNLFVISLFFINIKRFILIIWAIYYTKKKHYVRTQTHTQISCPIFPFYVDTLDIRF